MQFLRPQMKAVPLAPPLTLSFNPGNPPKPGTVMCLGLLCPPCPTAPGCRSWLFDSVQAPRPQAPSRGKGTVRPPPSDTRGWAFQVLGETISSNIAGEVQASRRRQWALCVSPRLPALEPRPTRDAGAIKSSTVRQPGPIRLSTPWSSPGPEPWASLLKVSCTSNVSHPPRLVSGQRSSTPALPFLQSRGQWMELPSHPEPWPGAAPLPVADFSSLVQSHQQ